MDRPWHSPHSVSRSVLGSGAGVVLARVVVMVVEVIVVVFVVTVVVDVLVMVVVVPVVVVVLVAVVVVVDRVVVVVVAVVLVTVVVTVRVVRVRVVVTVIVVKVVACPPSCIYVYIFIWAAHHHNLCLIYMFFSRVTHSFYHHFQPFTVYVRNNSPGRRNYPIKLKMWF